MFAWNPLACYLLSESCLFYGHGNCNAPPIPTATQFFYLSLRTSFWVQWPILTRTNLQSGKFCTAKGFGFWTIWFCVELSLSCHLLFNYSCFAPHGIVPRRGTSLGYLWFYRFSFLVLNIVSIPFWNIHFGENRAPIFSSNLIWSFTLTPATKSCCRWSLSFVASSVFITSTMLNYFFKHPVRGTFNLVKQFSLFGWQFNSISYQYTFLRSSYVVSMQWQMPRAYCYGNI